MKILKKSVGVIGRMLGAGETIKHGMELIDNMHTSKQEMIEAKTKAKIDLLSSYAPFKVAQRYLSLIFGFTFVATYVLVICLTLMGRDISSTQEIITAFKIDWIMLTIVGFYFGGGAFEGVLGKIKKD